MQPRFTDGETEHRDIKQNSQAHPSSIIDISEQQKYICYVHVYKRFLCDTKLLFFTFLICIREGTSRGKYSTVISWFSFINLIKALWEQGPCQSYSQYPQPLQQTFAGWISEWICLWRWDSGLRCPLKVSELLVLWGERAFQTCLMIRITCGTW